MNGTLQRIQAGGETPPEREGTGDWKTPEMKTEHSREDDMSTLIYDDMYTQDREKNTPKRRIEHSSRWGDCTPWTGEFNTLGEVLEEHKTFHIPVEIFPEGPS